MFQIQILSVELFGKKMKAPIFAAPSILEQL